LAILLALKFPNAQIDGSDISAEALEVAQINVKDYNMEHRVHLIQSNLLDSDQLKDNKYDVIICNPPYVLSQNMEKLPPEFKYEPKIALDGGEDGLDIIRNILAQIPSFLKEDGILVLEVGRNQREYIEGQFPKIKFQWLNTSVGNEDVFVVDAKALKAD